MSRNSQSGAGEAKDERQQRRAGVPARLDLPSILHRTFRHRTTTAVVRPKRTGCPRAVTAMQLKLFVLPIKNLGSGRGGAQRAVCRGQPAFFNCKDRNGNRELPGVCSPAFRRLRAAILPEGGTTNQRSNRSAHGSGRFSRCPDRICHCGDRIASCADRITRCPDRIGHCAHRIVRCVYGIIRCGDRIGDCDGRSVHCARRSGHCGGWEGVAKRAMYTFGTVTRDPVRGPGNPFTARADSVAAMANPAGAIAHPVVAVSNFATAVSNPVAAMPDPVTAVSK